MSLSHRGPSNEFEFVDSCRINTADESDGRGDGRSDGLTSPRYDYDDAPRFSVSAGSRPQAMKVKRITTQRISKRVMPRTGHYSSTLILFYIHRIIHHTGLDRAEP